MGPSEAELLLNSAAIDVAVAIRDTGNVDSAAYTRMREGAKDDAATLLAEAELDGEVGERARKTIVAHLGVNQLAQAVNYHAMIHAKLVIDADTDRAYLTCPVCEAIIGKDPSDGSTIACRAQVSERCYHGRKAAGVYPDGPEDDGTYDPSDGTVVCDPCYIALGQPLNAEIPGAIAAARGEA